MKTIQTKISKLKLDDNNARKHSKRNLDSIKLSLEKFGQQKPIVVNESGVIVAGHGTAVAAKELGWKTLDTVVTSLESNMQDAYAIADNRTAELAVWDDEALANTLKALRNDKGFDELVAGFSEQEIDDILDGGWSKDKSLLDAEEYNEYKHEKYLIKVEGVLHADRDVVLNIIADALVENGYDYKVDVH